MSGRIDPGAGTDLVDLVLRLIPIASIGTLWLGVTTVGLLYGFGVIR